MNNKIRYRLTFEKKGLARFIGHLDLQTLFHRALKRARVPMAYSQGFNPHMLISFAQPLPLGMESLCEMADIETTRETAPAEMAANLNAALPAGLVITGAKLLPPQTKRVAAAVCAAKYRLTFTREDYEKLLAAECLTHISDKILAAEFNQELTALELTLCAGGEKNLKPAIAAAAILEAAGLNSETPVGYTRTEIVLKYCSPD